jgi:hypothetical protein
MKVLKLLREIMDVKYLETPLFARQVLISKSYPSSFKKKNNGIAFRVKFRIQRWSADYRRAIAQSVGLKTEAGPSTGYKDYLAFTKVTVKVQI